MDQAKLMKTGIALAICWGVYKFAKGHTAIQAAALGTAGVIVAKQIPYVSDALA